jgi:hypothetical protein
MVAILKRLTQAQERQEIQLQRQTQDNAAAFAQIQAHQDEFQRQQLEIQRQQYLELLRHLVTVGVPPPPSVLTLALQPSGLQSQGSQPSFQFATHSAAGASFVSVLRLHSYSDGIHSTGSA